MKSVGTEPTLNRCPMRHKMRMSLNQLWCQTKPVMFILPFVVLWCEYLVYYWTLSWCAWAPVPNNGELLRAMIIADTHLLGPFRGHWFDKLRREWQMHRGFVTAQFYLDPDVHFILGDLFDEGQWCSLEQLQQYKARLHSLFPVPEEKPIYTAVGNHDIGFHYAMHPSRVRWFEQHFAAEPVRMFQLGDVHFVLINSMAMEGDGCRLCETAERQVRKLNRTLMCLEKGHDKCDGFTGPYSRPILMQHFPLFRHSDALCSEVDKMPDHLHSVFREGWECLSNTSTQFLLQKLQPRAVFAGHTHFGCITDWDSVVSSGCTEWTVASFSWRNTPLVCLDSVLSWYLDTVNPRMTPP